jgi:chaperonin GroES
MIPTIPLHLQYDVTPISHYKQLKMNTMDTTIQKSDAFARIVPFHDYLLIKPVPEATTTHGFVLPSVSTTNKPIVAEVVSVGTGRVEFGHTIPLLCKVGDRVYLDKYQSTEVTLGGETYLLIRENAVFGRLEN